MTIARPVAAFASALVTGSAVGLFSASTSATWTEESFVDDDCCSTNCNTDANLPPKKWGESLLDGFRYAFGPLIEDLAPWLTAGFVLAALLAVMIPDGMLTSIPSGWISSFLMMLIATPFYVCAPAATPIAAALIAKGLDPGAGLVFLLVGPATNITTILVVSRFMGNKVLAIHLGGVTVSALLFGAAVNAIYSGLSVDASAIMATTENFEVTLVQSVSMLALAVLLGYHLWHRVWSGPKAGGEARA